MQNGPVYQDWTPVVIHKNSKKKSSQSSQSIQNPAGHKEFLKLDSDDIPKILYVTRDEANNVIQARKAKNLKQEDLAKLLNINISIIKDFESQKLKSNKQLYNRIMNVLGVKCDK